MNAKSTEVTEGLVATTREVLPTQVGICSTLDGTMAKVLVEEDIVQTVARAAAERALGPERGLVASPPSSAALRNEAVECPTPSGLHFKWHSFAVRDIPVGAVIYLASPASKRPEVCCLQSILGARDDLANQRWREYFGEAAVWTEPLDISEGDVFRFHLTRDPQLRPSVLYVGDP